MYPAKDMSCDLKLAVHRRCSIKVQVQVKVNFIVIKPGNRIPACIAKGNYVSPKVNSQHSIATTRNKWTAHSTQDRTVINCTFIAIYRSVCSESLITA